MGAYTCALLRTGVLWQFCTGLSRIVSIECCNKYKKTSFEVFLKVLMLGGAAGNRTLVRWSISITYYKLSLLGDCFGRYGHLKRAKLAHHSSILRLRSYRIERAAQQPDTVTPCASSGVRRNGRRTFLGVSWRKAWHAKSSFYFANNSVYTY